MLMTAILLIPVVRFFRILAFFATADIVFKMEGPLKTSTSAEGPPP